MIFINYWTNYIFYLQEVYLQKIAAINMNNFCLKFRDTATSTSDILIYQTKSMTCINKKLNQCLLRIRRPLLTVVCIMPNEAEPEVKCPRHYKI